MDACKFPFYHSEKFITTPIAEAVIVWRDLPVERQRALKLYSSNKISSIASLKRKQYTSYLTDTLIFSFCNFSTDLYFIEFAKLLLLEDETYFNEKTKHPPKKLII